jgi:LacI family transcriptional regulator
VRGRGFPAPAPRLGYQANYSARALAAGRTGTIGLVVGDVALKTRLSGYWSPFLDGVGTGVRSGGSDLLIVGRTDRENEWARALRFLRQRRLDALIVPPDACAATVEDLDELDLPLVLAPCVGPSRHPSVTQDARPGIRRAMDRLAALGHRGVLWMEPTRAGQRADRSKQAESLAAAAGLAFDYAGTPLDHVPAPASAQMMIETARRGAHARFERGPLPTAVFAFNDLAAIGIATALRERGQRIPTDVSVIGYDDTHALFMAPALTTVSQNLQRIGREAARLALALADATDGAPGPAHAVVPTELVERASTAPPRRSI